MSPVLAIVLIYALIMSIVYAAYAVKSLIKWEIAEFSSDLVHLVVMSIISIDAFLRIFSPTQTGLW